MKSCSLPLLALLTCTALASCSPGVETPSPSPYPPSTVEVATGTVTGKVVLQGHLTYDGITVTIGELPPVTTRSDGTFAVQGVSQGQHAIKVEKAGYLSAEGQLTLSSKGETKTLASVTLLAGDLNGDGAIDLFDLVVISTVLGAQETESLSADLNRDGAVNVFDLVLVGNNFDQSGSIVFGSP